MKKTVLLIAAALVLSACAVNLAVSLKCKGECEYTTVRDAHNVDEK